MAKTKYRLIKNPNGSFRAEELFTKYIEDQFGRETRVSLWEDLILPFYNIKNQQEASEILVNYIREQIPDVVYEYDTVGNRFIR